MTNGRKNSLIVSMPFPQAHIITDLGITLVTIPYWWNRSASSLASQIHLSRPDISVAVPMSIAISAQPAKDIQSHQETVKLIYPKPLPPSVVITNWYTITLVVIDL